MDVNNIHSSIQLDITRALVKFFEDHGGIIDRDLAACLSSLEQEELQEAIHYAKMVRPSGNGSITDWCPEIINPNENYKYLDQVMYALVHRWCYLMSLLTPKQ